MQQAAQLTNSEVVQLLIKAMDERGPVGLNAVKFFLSTRTDEFREKADVTVHATTPDEVAQAIRGIYGVALDGKKLPAPADDASDELEPVASTYTDDDFR